MLGEIFKVVSRTKAWLWFSKNLMAHFTFRFWGYPTFPIEEAYNIPRIIEQSEKEGPGYYCFVCADRKSLATILIEKVTGSYFGHAGIVVPGKTLEETRIYHMKGIGHCDWNILTLLKEVDDFAILKFPVSKEIQEKILKRVAFSRDNSELFLYDFSQEWPNDPYTWEEIEQTVNDKQPVYVYCSEFCFIAGDRLVTNPDFKPHTEFGRLIFEPDDLYKAGKVIFERRYPNG